MVSHYVLASSLFSHGLNWGILNHSRVINCHVFSIDCRGLILRSEVPFSPPPPPTAPLGHLRSLDPKASHIAFLHPHSKLLAYGWTHWPDSEHKARAQLTLTDWLNLPFAFDLSACPDRVIGHIESLGNEFRFGWKNSRTVRLQAEPSIEFFIMYDLVTIFMNANLNVII